MSDFKKILPVYLATRIAVFAIGAFSSLVIKGGGVKPKSFDIIKMFFKWDGDWYMSIVEHGYSVNPGNQSNVAFFPLYPFAVKIISFLTGNPILVGFLLSNIALFFGALLLYKIAKLDYGEQIAEKSVFYMLVFPTSFYFSIFYTEGFFALFSLASMYFAIKRKWMWVGISGFLLSLTNILGVFVFIPVLLEYLRFDFSKIKKDVFWLLLIPAGLCSYMAFLYIKFGDALAFLHVQKFWGRSFSFPIKALSSAGRYPIFYKDIFLLTVLFALFLLLWFLRERARFSLLAFFAVYFYLFMSSGVLESIPRFVLVIFPMYIAMALLAEKNRFFSYAFDAFMPMLLCLMVILFVNGYWIT